MLAMLDQAATRLGLRVAARGSGPPLPFAVRGGARVA